MSGRELEILCSRFASHLKIKNGKVAVFLLSEKEMKKMKLAFYPLEKPEYVDVLSFREPKSFPHPELRGKLLGEIYLNLEIARENKKRAIFLLIHGFLHLLGYDHNKKGDMIKMQKKEEELGKLVKVDIKKFYAAS